MVSSIDYCLPSPSDPFSYFGHTSKKALGLSLHSAASLLSYSTFAQLILRFQSFLAAAYRVWESTNSLSRELNIRGVLDIRFVLPAGAFLLTLLSIWEFGPRRFQLSSSYNCVSFLVFRRMKKLVPLS